jgi:hypothetical protein
LIAIEPATHRLQTKIRQMVPNTHNPAPAIAHDTSMDATVTINATQANMDKILIGHLSEETPHQGQR